MRIFIWFFTLLFCKCKGSDIYGNKYYTFNKPFSKIKKRIVVYNGKVEASKVASYYDLWLRGAIDSFPKKNHTLDTHKTPNLTGTKIAYKYAKYQDSDSNTGLNYYNKWEPNKK